jgi:hypothetical protein
MDLPPLHFITCITDVGEASLEHLLMCCYGSNSVTGPSIAILYRSAHHTTPRGWDPLHIIQCWWAESIGNIYNFKLIEHTASVSRDLVQPLEYYINFKSKYIQLKASATGCFIKQRVTWFYKFFKMPHKNT